MEVDPTVFVVGHDEETQNWSSKLLESVGLKMEAFAYPQEFLDKYDYANPGCLITEVRMPGMSGLQMQQKLSETGMDIPIVFLSSCGDIPIVVDAMKAGAVDFIEKPAKEQTLLDSIYRALAKDRYLRLHRREIRAFTSRIARLTPRELEVARLLAHGKSDKEIAADLGISVRGAAFHRANILDKLGLDSILHLARMVAKFNMDKGGAGSKSPLSIL